MQKLKQKNSVPLIFPSSGCVGWDPNFLSLANKRNRIVLLSNYPVTKTYRLTGTIKIRQQHTLRTSDINFKGFEERNHESRSVPPQQTHHSVSQGGPSQTQRRFLI